jgi:hypothetical protein
MANLLNAFGSAISAFGSALSSGKGGRSCGKCGYCRGGRSSECPNAGLQLTADQQLIVVAEAEVKKTAEAEAKAKAEAKRLAERMKATQQSLLQLTVEIENDRKVTAQHNEKVAAVEAALKPMHAMTPEQRHLFLLDMAKGVTPTPPVKQVQQETKQQKKEETKTSNGGGGNKRQRPADPTPTPELIKELTELFKGGDAGQKRAGNALILREDTLAKKASASAAALEWVQRTAVVMVKHGWKKDVWSKYLPVETPSQETSAPPVQQEAPVLTDPPATTTTTPTTTPTPAGVVTVTKGNGEVAAPPSADTPVDDPWADDDGRVYNPNEVAALVGDK